ncbi:MAG: methionine synthase [Thermoanaerobaculia bacterium]|jgi:5-methyltetrahydrofolate--homocysteine methyltransferase
MNDLHFDVPIPECPDDQEARTQALLESLEERILVMDGATGTGLQAEDLTAEDFGGPDLEGCNENLCLTRPDVVLRLHQRYLEAGADIVQTNSFGGTPLVLAEYDLEAQAYDLNRLAAEMAREAAWPFSVPARPRFVCGSMGPTTKAISVTGGVTFQELIEHYRVQALGLMAGGADYLLLETCQDTRNIKAGLLALDKAFSQAGWRVPVAVSVTIETTGTMLAGQDAEALAVSLMHADLLYLGLNCATGPELMTDSLRTLSELARTRIGCVPNAGLPDEDGIYQESPEDFRRIFGRFLDHGWLNMVGGCCGTTNEHVTALAELVKGAKPRALPHHQRSFISGIEAVELTIDNRPLFVGERTNVLGSRKFKRLIAEGEIEAAAEIGRGQARAGAQAIDICMQDPDRDEVTDMERFLDQLTRMVKVPLMIDTTDAEVMEQALTWCQGKAVLNSINLEEGRTRFERVIPLARQYGAAVIVGMIDEAGMAVSVVRKLEVARRSYQILTEEMDFAPEDIWFDALVFPCGTGDENYIGSAATTIEGVRQIKSEFPLARTVLGISNVSFGLPVAGREVLNAVFLYHNTQAGLDAALVNTQRLARFADIPEAERRLAESLIFLDLGDVAASEKAVADFAEYFRDQDSRVVSTPRAELPLDERLARSVVEGSKEGLVEDLGVALEDPSWPQPLDIINGPLMVGMAEVGRLFNENQLIVAEVLQSAEVMKAAVGFLEPHMERQEGTSRGKILLATVKGDVHDIGKNLVEIILSNNGFDVVNLGIKVPSERIIQAVQEHQPDVLGLSGLLVKSAQMMVTTADDLSVVDIDIPLIVGGAALTRRFTHKKIAATYDGFCTYAKDAMHGLSLVQRITDAAKRPDLEAEVRELIARDRQAETAPTPFEAMGSTRCAAVDIDLDPPAPPHLDRIVEELDLDEVWPLLNPQMLYGKHLGLKASVKQLEAKHDPKLAHLKGVIGEIQEVARSGAMKARAVWQFFPAASDGNRLLLLDPGTGKAVVEWSFPRQRGTDGLGLPDYVLPQGDHVALFVTTAGDGVMKQVEQWKQEGEFLMSHALAALALETAEAAAELVHRKMRQAWGFADAQEMTLQDLFAGRYRGKRYSFGYPACPDLEMQRELFSTLRPEEIGVRLTEGDMMEPEASVSALVFHHPQARYFGV